MATMEERIAEAINKNLSTEVGEVLKQRLQEASRDRKDLEKLRGDYDRMKETADLLRSDLTEQAKMDKRERDLIDRENKVAERERRLENSLLRKELEAEQRITKVFETAIIGLVRNTEFRKRIKGSVPTTDGLTAYQDSIEETTHE